MLKVSIITVAFNALETIEQTINSVINQGYPNIEYIIIDGGSSDGTVDIIKEYTDHLAYWISEPDDGIYYAMNKGLQHVTGDIVGIINSDDWYEPHAVAEAVEYFERESRVQAVAGQIREIDRDGYCKTSTPGKMEDIWSFMPVKHPAVFFRKSLYDIYGGFDTQYRIAADYELIFRLFVNRVRFRIVDNVWTNFRTEGISSTEFVKTATETIDIKRRYLENYGAEIDINDFEECNTFQMNMAYLALDISRGGRLTDTVIKRIFSDEILIYGCGNWGRAILKRCKEIPVNVGGIFDGNSELWGKKIEGNIIRNPKELAEIEGKILIAIYTRGDEIIRHVRQLCNEKTQIHSLYDIAVMIKDLGDDA